MKKSLLTFLALSSAVFASSNTYIDIDTKIGNKLFQNEMAYQEYLKKEALQNLRINESQKIADRNTCEIQRIKKVLVKLIKERERERGYVKYTPISKETSNSTNLVKVNTKKAEEIFNIKKKTDKTKCTKKLIKVIDKSHIEESYFKYKIPKQFRVTYKLAGEFKYPVLKSEVSNMLYKNNTFKADMYTKAGWVHNINGGWIKGYKLFPRIENKTTQKDIEKWGMKYKIITDCKKGGE